jgi:Flp pilus assembly protein TadG
MVRKIGSGLARDAHRFLSRLRRNCDGVAALEFGLLAPLLLVMLLGTIELGRAIMIDRKLGMVTSSVADVVAREKTLNASDVTALYAVADHIMKPWPSATLKIAIIPVKASPTNQNDVRVYAGTANRPSYHGAAQQSKCSTYSLPSNMLEKGASVIVVETSYQFTPLFNIISGLGTNWTDRAELAPRQSCVDFDGTNCLSNCWAGG